jgi:stage V sporulation protein AC
MALTPNDYSQMTKRASPNTKSWRNIPLAFLIGGLICTLGQGLTQLFLSRGLPQDEASSWTSVCLVFLSVLLTGLKVYDNIAKFGGAGTLVPITGFANAVASPAIEFKSDDRVIIGTSQKHHEIKVDVLVYCLLIRQAACTAESLHILLIP